MKRSHLLFALAGAFGMALLGSASKALAACPAGALANGTIGPLAGALLNGNYAIKVVGAQVDNGVPTTDPQPLPVAGIGVFHADGLCDITAGEFIYDDNGVFTGPGTDVAFGFPSVVTFTGGPGNGSPANIVPSAGPGTSNYFLKSDNTGVLTLVDSASGNTFMFGIAVEIGGTEFRGARINNAGVFGALPNDVLTIVGERQASPVLLTQIVPSIVGNNIPSEDVSIHCDTVKIIGSPPDDPLGLGYLASAGTVQFNLDPNLTGAIEAGGNYFFNNNGGTINGGPPPLGFAPGYSAFICDYNSVANGGPYLTDGTGNSDTTYLSNFGCIVAGVHNEGSSVVWGAQNQNSFSMPTGSNGSPSPGVTTCTASKALAGLNSLTPPPGIIVVPGLANNGASTTKSIVLSNGSGKPLNIAAIGLAGPIPDITVDPSSTCPGAVLNPPGSVPSFNPVIGPPINGFATGYNTCTIVLKCNKAGLGPEVGTLTINADNKITGSTLPGAVQTIPVTCNKV